MIRDCSRFSEGVEDEIGLFLLLDDEKLKKTELLTGNFLEIKGRGGAVNETLLLLRVPDGFLQLENDESIHCRRVKQRCTRLVRGKT